MADQNDGNVIDTATQDADLNKGNEGNEGANTPAVLTDEQVLALLSERGIKVDSFETLKQKAEYTPPAPAPTDEQKLAEERAKEKRLLDAHIARGGSVEQFTYFKQIAAAEAKELGVQKTKKDLVDAGFSAEQAEKISREMHFDVAEEDLEGLDDDEKANKLKLKEFGQKKIEKRGTYLKNTATSYLDGLSKEIQASDEEKTKMEQHASNVEAAIKDFQRKQSLNLGQLDGQDIAPVDYEIPEEVISKTADLLKDASKLDQQFFNKDGSVNLDFVLPLVIKANAYESAVKTGYLTGATRQVEIYEKTFSSKPPNLGGVQRPVNSGSNKVVGKGKSQVVTYPQNN